MQQFDITRRLVVEALGTAILLATVVGSGIMGERLADGNAALAHLGSTLPTGAILIVLILIFGPVSGGHFNPAVTLSFFIRREITLATSLLYVVVQVLGGVAGVIVAHVMFELPVVQFSETVRTGSGQWLSEAIATFGLVAAILGTLRFCPAAVPYAVGLFISAGYWFTASTSFANPAVTIARSFTDTFSGIQPGHAPAFILAQVVGAVTATVLFAWLLRSEPTIADAVDEQADTL